MQTYKLVAQLGFDENGNPWYEKVYLDEPLKQCLISPFSSSESLVIAYLKLGKDLNSFNFTDKNAESLLISAIKSEHPELDVGVSNFIKTLKEHPLPFSPDALDGRSKCT